MTLSFKDNSLPKSIILRNRLEIDEIFKQGTYIKRDVVTLLILKSDQEKVAFFVSKHSGIAVRRNLLKRWCREIYRCNKEFFLGLKIIFLIKTKRVFSFQELETAILGTALHG